MDKVTSGFVTKDEYEGAVRAYYNRQIEMKSEARDKVIVMSLATNSQALAALSLLLPNNR